MLIWVDLANSPHVPFFGALKTEFERRGHGVLITARDFAQTVEMAEKASLSPIVIGGFGGRKLTGKAGNLWARARALARWARGREIDLAVSHNSYSQILAARMIGIKSITLMDYEHQPANHLAFRLASRVIVPKGFPQKFLMKYGARASKVRRYEGTKEDVYLADFVPNQEFSEKLRELGVAAENILVVVRPPASDALYHRFENELFDELLKKLVAQPNLKIILLARNHAQRETYSSRFWGNMIVPHEALDGANLIASADLVISAGGTMNREAAALGVPAATIYAGKWAAIDEELVREGRLMRVASREDLDALPLKKKDGLNPRRATHVREQVVNLILEQ
ncbi:MAG: hypothetical protein AUG51_21555 [Acidobacteria bacterium 13_1_20CM_3_53_8]|nr:MAG: hypothetical protein AUG51_21555 [Acidobacteria bacterium 13_1_20CM_3_53_8]